MTPLDWLPHKDIEASLARKKILQLARQSNLMMFHFEQRIELEKPSIWGDSPKEEWRRGELVEGKYSHFRNDLMIGSFNPSHRSKWTSHELCHNLLGFAWKPQATGFFFALASRVSECLPVSLFYFLDEVALKKCKRHQFSGALYQEECAECEHHANWDSLVEEKDLLRDAMRFYQQEIGAVKESLRTGSWVENSLFGLNLSSDALAYTKAQFPRLQDPLFAKYVETFPGKAGVCQSSVESLIERSDQIMSALTKGTALEPWKVDANYWIASDLAWRLLQFSKLCEGTDLEEALHNIAFGPLGTWSAEGIEDAISQYEKLFEDYECISPEEMFATGYPLPKVYGYSTDKILRGLESVVPISVGELLTQDQGQEIFDKFCENSLWRRENLGQRLLHFLQQEGLGDLASLVELEMALAAPKNLDSEARLLPKGEVPQFLQVSRDTQVVFANKKNCKKLKVDLPSLDEQWVLFLKLGESRTDLQIFPVSLDEWDTLNPKAIEFGYQFQREETNSELLDSLYSWGALLPVQWSEG